MPGGPALTDADDVEEEGGGKYPPKALKALTGVVLVGGAPPIKAGVVLALTPG